MDCLCIVTTKVSTTAGGGAVGTIPGRGEAWLGAGGPPRADRVGMDLVPSFRFGVHGGFGWVWPQVPPEMLPLYLWRPGKFGGVLWFGEVSGLWLRPTNGQIVPGMLEGGSQEKSCFSYRLPGRLHF